MKGFATSPDGNSIAFEEQGTGKPTLVFVHGWVCDRSYWRNQLDHFSRKHHVVILDLAGHGDSGSNRKDWTMSAFGDDVASVIEELRLKDVVMIGHSMGGDVIVEAALRVPDRVRGLVWVDTWRTFEKLMTDAEAKEFAAPFRADFQGTAKKFIRRMFNLDSDKTVEDFVVNDMASSPPNVGIGALEHAVIYDRVIVKLLPKLRIPLVAINPDYKTTNAQSLEKHGVKKVIILPGTAHFMFIEQPDEFNKVLENAISEF